MGWLNTRFLSQQIFFKGTRAVINLDPTVFFIFIGFIFLPCFILGRLLHFDFLSCVTLITLVEHPRCPVVISPLDATTLQVDLELQVLKIFCQSEALIPRPGLSLLSGFLQLYGWFSHSRTCCFVCSGTSTSFPVSTLTSHIETVREDVMTGPLQNALKT